MPATQRDGVRDACGEDAEALAHACCAASPGSLERALDQGDPGLVQDRRRRASLGIDRDTMVAVATLNLAHCLARQARIEPTDADWDDEVELFELAEPYLPAIALEALGQVYRDEPRDE